jgi:hypothetical protein
MTFNYVYDIKALLLQTTEFIETISINFSQGIGEMIVAGRASVNVLRRLFGF